MANRGCPAFTSLPSRNSRFCKMPAARARTCATREASRRPGSSVIRPTSPGLATTTPTSGGGMPPPGGAAGASPLPQAESSSAAPRQPTARACRWRDRGDAGDRAETVGAWRKSMGFLRKSPSVACTKAGSLGFFCETCVHPPLADVECWSIYTSLNVCIVKGLPPGEMPMARRTKADAQATRNTLLDAAERLFEEKGGSRPAGPLEQLIAQPPRGAPAPGMDQVYAAILEALRHIATDASLRRVMQIGTHRVEYVAELDAVQARHLTLHRQWLARNRSALEHAFAQRPCPAAVSPDMAALGQQVLVEGLLQSWLLDTEAFDLVQAGRCTIATYL